MALPKTIGQLHKLLRSPHLRVDVLKALPVRCNVVAFRAKLDVMRGYLVIPRGVYEIATYLAFRVGGLLGNLIG
jgi:hypothetical protein